MSVIEHLLELLGVGAPLAVAVMLVILGLMSKRLGAVTHMPAYYKWLYGAAALACAATFLGLLYILGTFSTGAEAGLFYDEGFYVVAYVVPLAVSLTIGAVVGWRYWGWLLGERGK
ncbi:MAG: hypothetical protein JXB47_15200 [Anaerolineae bacterium]|nr:hypothetical protein [Anaerolineae bacterium]